MPSKTKTIRRKWTPYMERLIIKYYPDWGKDITYYYLKDKIPDFPFSRKEIMVRASRLGVAGNHKDKGKFKKGMTSWCKGMKMEVPQLEPHQYKKGHISPRELPIGSTKLQSTGYWWIKIAQRPTKWRQLHLHIWEEVNGPIPKGKLLWFKDNNPENCVIENLECGTRAEMFKLKVQVHNPKHQKKTA